MNYKATVNKYSANVRACEHCEALTPSFQLRKRVYYSVFLSWFQEYTVIMAEVNCCGLKWKLN